MFRHLHPTDSTRLLAFSQAAGRAEAFALQQAIQPRARSFSAVKYAGIAFSPRAWQSCWLWTDGSRINALLRAGPRSGRLAWEVRELFLNRSSVYECAEVLEDVAVPAGKAGAARLFLRLPQGSPVFDQARRAGYAPSISETLYRTSSAADALDRLGRPGAPPGLRPQSDADANGLFRLYCSVTPVEARMGCGQTMAEWQDAAEKPTARARDFVVADGAEHISASVNTGDVGGDRYFAVEWARDYATDPAGLVGAALSGARAGAVALVPSHQQGLAALLEDAGFEPVCSYDLMAKVLAVPVRESRRAVAAVG